MEGKPDYVYSARCEISSTLDVVCALCRKNYEDRCTVIMCSESSRKNIALTEFLNFCHKAKRNHSGGTERENPRYHRLDVGCALPNRNSEDLAGVLEKTL